MNETLRSPIGTLFDINDQIITDSSGSGNNWAQGYFEYGSKHEKRFLELASRSESFCLFYFVSNTKCMHTTMINLWYIFLYNRRESPWKNVTPFMLFS